MEHRMPARSIVHGRIPATLLFALALGCTLLVTGCSGKPKVVVDPEIEEAVRVRKQNFSEIGTIAKNINDALKAGSKLQGDPTIASSVQQLGSYASDQKFWFKEGTGPESGADTAARPEIWTQPEEFAQKSQALVEASAQLATVYASGDDAAFATQWKVVGQACEACHEKFKNEDKDD
jgi:cytochrome c556